MSTLGLREELEAPRGRRGGDRQTDATCRRPSSGRVPLPRTMLHALGRPTLACRLARLTASSVTRRQSNRALAGEAYTHGHHASVVAQHSARTAENSARFLLDHISGGDRILDVGCGPGSITVGLARRVGPTGRVVAIDVEPRIVKQAAATAQAAGLENISCRVGRLPGRAEC